MTSCLDTSRSSRPGINASRSRAIAGSGFHEARPLSCRSGFATLLRLFTGSIAVDVLCSPAYLERLSHPTDGRANDALVSGHGATPCAVRSSGGCGSAER